MRLRKNQASQSKQSGYNSSTIQLQNQSLENTGNEHLGAGTGTQSHQELSPWRRHRQSITQGTNTVTQAQALKHTHNDHARTQEHTPVIVPLEHFGQNLTQRGHRGRT